MTDRKNEAARSNGSVMVTVVGMAVLLLILNLTAGMKLVTRQHR